MTFNPEQCISWYWVSPTFTIYRSTTITGVKFNHCSHGSVYQVSRICCDQRKRMATFTLDLHQFHISVKYGFMLEDPLVRIVQSPLT